MRGHKNILVVGGAGYIGSHMLLHLEDTGYQFTVFDNLSRGFADAVPQGSLILGDLRSSSDLDKCFQNNKYDLVMHFSAFAYVGESVAHPELYYKNNVLGSINLFSKMKQYGIRRLVLSSTCAVYGNAVSEKIDEDHPRSPINPYGRTKLMVERIFSDYASAYGMNGICLRYFNAAGCDPQARAGERHNPETHLIPIVLSEALRLQKGGNPKDTELVVNGNDFPTFDGSCIRDYIHVCDLCDAHLRSVNRLWKNEVDGFEIYNLSNGNGFSVLEIIDSCKRITGQPIAYRIAGRRIGDPPTLVGNSEKAKTILKWKPHFTDLDEIVWTAWHWLLLQDRKN